MSVQRKPGKALGTFKRLYSLQYRREEEEDDVSSYCMTSGKT
jgi:hypothetical protein